MSWHDSCTLTLLMMRLPLFFANGLPGFEGERRFTLVEDASHSPLLSLESETTPNLRFYALPMSVIDPGYDLQLSPEDLGLLELEQVPGEETVLCLAILAAPENGPFSANLLAPVVVNCTRSLAVQAVRMDQRYSHCHPLGKTSCS